MTSDNGRIVGPDNTPTPTVASGVWGLDELYEARLGNIWPSILVPTFAMELVTPSSIAFAGTSASIVGNGSVTFSAVTSLSLNGVFSSTYDNYMVAIGTNISIAANVNARLRVSGTDDSTANSYVDQSLEGNGTTVGGNRTTSNTVRLFPVNNLQRTGVTVFVYGPNLAQPTAARTVTANDAFSARIFDVAFTHNQPTAYDGFTLLPQASASLTGRIAVYGLRG